MEVAKCMASLIVENKLALPTWLFNGSSEMHGQPVC
jgi:hypothetical protein